MCYVHRWVFNQISHELLPANPFSLVGSPRGLSWSEESSCGPCFSAGDETLAAPCAPPAPAHTCADTPGRDSRVTEESNKGSSPSLCPSAGSKQGRLRERQRWGGGFVLWSPLLCQNVYLTLTGGGECYFLPLTQ